MVILIGSVVCGFDSGVDGDINVLWFQRRDNIDIDGFGSPCSDDGIDGDINWFGRPWFRPQLMVLIDSVVRGFGGGIDGDID